VWNDPGEHHDHQKRERAKGFEDGDAVQSCHGIEVRAPHPARVEHVTEEIKIEIEKPDDGSGEVLWFSQALKTHEHAILEGLSLEIEQRADHGVFLMSAVARKKTSSRLASPACSENLCRISSMVPSMIFSPFFRMST
jgi:hypothetical protein